MFTLFENPHQEYRLSNHLLVSGLLMLLIGIVLAYCFEAQLSMLMLLGAHLMTVVGPTAIKIGYVLRLHSLRRLDARAAP